MNRRPHEANRIPMLLLASLLLMLFGACADNTPRHAASEPLPQRCGDYDLTYGNIDSHGIFRKTDGTVVNLLDGLDAAKYVGKRVALSGKYWIQRGGLLNPDGSDASFSADNLLEATIVQVADGGFDRRLIEKKCEELEEKK